MKSEQRQYIAIDLKAFYASVECVERGLNPLDTCLVVADRSRTEKTICLAVSPPLKAFGIKGRPRLFEVSGKIKEINRQRGCRGKSTSGAALAADNELAADYFVAPPRMSLYIDYSARIYRIYLRYVAAEDIHVYSIDEVMIDVTPYLATYGMSAHELARTMIRDVMAETGITATAGIGTNLYLCKVAMDIMAKKMPPDSDGVRIAELDEMSYRRQLWSHRPLTDFWRVGHGIAARLARYGILTMGDIARCSLRHESMLYSLLGVNAELLIDHAWGWEPVTMAEIKAYRPEARSISSGQVLASAYTADKARIVVLEMADAIALDLLDKGLVSDRFTLTLNYGSESLADPEIRARYAGRIRIDRYGRETPVHSHGICRLARRTSSMKLISEAVAALFDRIVNQELLVRRLTLTAENVAVERTEVESGPRHQQLELFTDYEALKRANAAERLRLVKERRRQQTVLKIKKMFGRNAILRGLNFADGATQRERNTQIGGHHE